VAGKNVEGGMQRALKAFGIVMIGLAVTMTSADFAEARKAGGFSSFGSRGSKTFSAPATTSTAPTSAAPIQRSMTPNTAQPGGIGQAAQAAPKRGLFGGLAGGLMGGLLMGGLFGMLMGGGFGGLSGMFGMLFQILLIGGAIMLAMRFFGRNRTAQAYSGSDNRTAHSGDAPQPSTSQGFGGFAIPKIGGSAQPAAVSGSDEVGITQKDLETFEELLKEMQQAYAAEDYSALRRITTPEAMSYLAEELGENATKGVKNDVRDVKLLQGDLSEAWREGNVDYATVAMRYESIDVMRDRTTGKVVEGDPDHVGESVEVWTFIRRPATGWSISAIQSA
jgi:predicted lipid-binding transport protein (Tim44 family)